LGSFIDFDSVVIVVSKLELFLPDDVVLVFRCFIVLKENLITEINYVNEIKETELNEINKILPN
jgi:hypothetical protein